MKESEKLYLAAQSEENDFRAMGLRKKARRQERLEKFSSDWLDRLAFCTDVELRENGSYTFETEDGIVDFFPKANRLLIRKTNTWKSNGLSYILKIIEDYERKKDLQE